MQRDSVELERAVRERTAPLLDRVLGASFVILALTTFLAWLGKDKRNVGWWTYEVGFAVTVASAVLRWRGHLQTAGVVLSLGFCAMASAAVVLLGGPVSPGTFLLVPIVLTTALFWSRRAATLLAAWSVALVLVTAWLSAMGRLPPSLETSSPATLASVCAGSLAITVVLSHALLRALNGAADDAQNRRNELLALFRESPDAIVVLDDTGIVRDVNPAAFTMGGLSESGVVGRHFASLGVFTATDAAVAIRRFPGLLRHAHRTFPLRLTRADGSIRWGDVHSRVVAGGDGMRRLQLTIRDATQRKLIEQRRAELEGHLLKLQRFENIGLLSGAVAHDVNNMLAVVALVASSLRSRLGSHEQELADELIDSAARAVKLNRRLLLVGRQDGSHEQVDVNAVVDGMRRLLERLAGDIELVIELDPSPCVIRANAAQLEQMIINLTANARDAMPGHGRLTIATRRSRPPGPAGTACESIVLCVADTGTGMDADTQQRIFEPFFTTKGQSGTGLGLATVRDIMTGLGGRVEVASQPGSGTEFALVFPRLDGTGAAGTSESPRGFESTVG